MIILKQLTWNNLFSYGLNNSIVLNSDPITQLVGLNGHGKSSIPLILEEILFNKNSKGIKKSDIVNRLLDTNKYSASCLFSIDNDDYEIHISRTGAAQKVKLLKNSEDISSHTATDTFKEVEKLFGLDAKTFSQLVYQNSASSLQFLTATDTNRKKFLIDLLSLDKYIILFETIKLAHKETSDLVLQLSSKVKTINDWLDKYKDFDPKLKELVEVEEIDAELPDSISKLKLKLADIEQINAKIVNNNKYIEIVGSIPATDLIIKDERIDTSSIIKRINEFQLLIKQHQTTINKFKGIHEGECPTCLQSINLEIINDLVTSSSDAIESFNKELKELNNELAKAKEQNQKISDREKLIADFEKYSVLIDKSLPTILLSKDEISLSLKKLQKELADLNQKIEEATKYNSSVVSHNAKIEVIKEQLATHLEELNDANKELDKVSSKIGLLEVLKKAFSTSGLIAYKIESSVKELELLTNSYLSELSDGRFQLSFEIVNDKLNVVIIDDNKSIDITALSAGELARVTTATLIAIRKLMSTLSKAKLNVLFLDETIDVLDQYGKEKLIEVLLKEDLNTFIISHSYNHPLVKKINIIKEEGISRLEDG